VVVACGAPPPEGDIGAPASLSLEDRMAGLQRELPELLNEAGVPGLSIAVVRDGVIDWVRGFGSTAADGGQAVDEHTVFGAASLTKPVVAYAVMKLADAGEIELDRPLMDYLQYEDLAGDPRAARITARMVLSHSTGLPNWCPGRWSGDPQPLVTQFEPGTRWQYSGEGFIFLQRVVERLSGKSLDVLLRDMVFEPLGMGSSSLLWEERFAAAYAMPHHEDLTPREDRRPEEALAAGTLLTTAADYARFLIAVMSGQGLAPETLRAIQTRQVEIRQGLGWGLGWRLETVATETAIWQWGHDPGYRAFAIAVPERRFGMVFFSNSDNGMLLLRRIVGATLGGDEHPALDHLAYDSLDSPRRLLALELERVAVEQGAEAVAARYQELRETYPEAPFGEVVLNRLGYRRLGRDRVDAAIAVFRLNVDAYPEAANPYDSLGEAYMMRGDSELAIANYQRSLELDPDNGNAVAMLERLRVAE
jgi:CubicO group peptidase (beta-lactamase class C family)